MTLDLCRHSPRWSVACLVLLLALSACGDSARNTAPPPAPRPPAFQPQPVAVQLGQTDESVTLMTTEAGGYTRNGQPFPTGSEVTGANGRIYTFTLRDGTWAAVVQPLEIPVGLGTSGETIQISAEETGGYTLNGEEVVDGATLVAGNGSTYRLMLADGAWSAEFVPMSVEVRLGSTGDVVTLATTEDGGYTRLGQPFSSGATISGNNGRRYEFTLADGTWTASIVPATVNVPLGASGLTVAITVGEVGEYSIAGVPLRNGDTYTAGNGSTYRLLGSGENWTAGFMPGEVTVQVSGSGRSIQLWQESEGVFRYQGQPVADGDLVDVGAGVSYRLSISATGVTASFESDATVLALGQSGKTLELTQRPDGNFELDGQTVKAGHVYVDSSDGNSYTLLLESGEWKAVLREGRFAIPVGDSGETLTIVKRPDGYFLEDGRTLLSGRSHTAEDGAMYRIRFQNGEWSAEFQNRPVIVRLVSGPAVLTVREEEDGTFTYDGKEIWNRKIIEHNGRFYRLVQGSDGVWSAERYRPPSNTVVGSDPDDSTDPGDDSGSSTGSSVTHGTDIDLFRGNLTEASVRGELAKQIASNLLSLSASDVSTELAAAGESVRTRTIGETSFGSLAKSQIDGISGEVSAFSGTFTSSYANGLARRVRDAIQLVLPGSAQYPLRTTQGKTVFEADLANLVTAISSPANFESAFGSNGVFADYKDMIPTAAGTDVSSTDIIAVYNAKGSPLEISVRRDSGVYSLGAWTSTSYDDAIDAVRQRGFTRRSGAYVHVLTSGGDRGFSLYEPGKQILPTGSASYTGTTLAIDKVFNEIYEGSIGINVKWGNALADATFTTTISNLVTDTGNNSYNSYNLATVGLSNSSNHPISGFRLQNGSVVSNSSHHLLLEDRGSSVNVVVGDDTYESLPSGSSFSLSGTFLGALSNEGAESAADAAGIVGTWTFRGGGRLLLEAVYGAGP